MASSRKASEVDAYQNQSGQHTVLSTTEHEHEEKTRQDRRRVRSDWNSDASTSCGSECAEKCWADPNLVGILLSSSSESEPLCEMSSEWTPITAIAAAETVAAESVTPRTWFPNHRTEASEGSKRGVLRTTADGSTVENEGVKTLLMSTSDGAQLRKVTFQVANANKALESVSKMVRNGNRVVLDAHQDHTSRIR